MTAQTILPANSTTGGFEVSNSLRFNVASTDYLALTPGSAGNTKLWTWSAWFKKSVIGADMGLFGQFVDANNGFRIKFRDDDRLQVDNYASGSATMNLILTQQLKDPAAWYHLVVAYDSAQSTASNTVKIYINGTRVTAFNTETYPSQNVVTTLPIDGSPMELGRTTQSSNDPQYFGGYFSEVVLVDGQALDPTSFGEFDDVTTTVWKPKKILGALNFGDNGFYLQFKQSGTGTNASGMGADTSGNTNHFAVNNLTAVDQSIDTCTNNFCTLNPSQIGPRNNQADSAGTFSEGNLNVLMTGSGDDFAGTIAVSTGKWFYEVKLLTAANHGAGFTLLTDFTGESTVSNGIANGDFQYGSAEGGAGSKIANNGDVSVAPQNNFDDNDIIGFAFDIDGGTLKIYNNGSLDRTISSIPAGTYVPMGGDDSSTDANLAFNFGSPAYAISSGNADGNGYGNFEYAVPSGYFAICTKNLAEYG